MRTQALDNFCAWIERTPLSQAIQVTSWSVPAVQTVHILAIAAVMASVLPKLMVKEGAKDVEDFLLAADAGLYSSEHESFGLSILETLFYGKPVVAFRVGGIPEVVVDGECGFLHPFGDIDAMARSLALLASSPERASEMGASGRRRAHSAFTAEQVIPQYEALYRRVIR